MTRRFFLAFALFAAASAPGVAHGSIAVAEPGSGATLAVDSRGNALVTWTESGSRKTLLIPEAGRYLPGGSLAGPDVSKPAPDVDVPFKVVVRRTPDGRLWALQRWQAQPGRPADLRFSRWKGAPSIVTGSVAGARLTGRATFQGRGIFGTSPTTAGTPVRHYAFVDCFGCATASGWHRVLGVDLRGPGGTYAVGLTGARSGKRYRVTVMGPNRGTTYAPDATVVVDAA